MWIQNHRTLTSENFSEGTGSDLSGELNVGMTKFPFLSSNWIQQLRVSNSRQNGLSASEKVINQILDHFKLGRIFNLIFSLMFFDNNVSYLKDV